jgi:septal ring factor EnvC (AmiA/AmiB activator)
MNRRLMPLLACMLLSMALHALPAVAAERAADARAKLAEIQQERARLADVRRQLEARLGALGQQMHTLDVALAAAQQALLQATAQVAETDRKLKALGQQQQGLQQHIADLRQAMVTEAIGAWQRAGRDPGWLDVLRGVPMGEIPNRRYMMKQVLASQHADRLDLQRSEAKLDAVMADLQKERDRRETLRRQRAQAEQAIRQQIDGKRALVAAVKKNAGLQRQRDAELARQAKALKKLLETFGGDLLAADRVSEGPSIRAEKGRLSWPLQPARIVARYGSRPARQRDRLHGVLLAPEGQRRQVKSISAGRVRYADWFGGYGLMLIVDHGHGVMSIYAHNDVLYKHLGDWVEKGDVLAEAGSTGWIDKVRLYFEVRDKGRPVNPALWCRNRNR